MGKINNFSEIEIREAILNKVPLSKINKKSKHWKGYISINGKLTGKVKIPNAHQRIMYSSKSMYIARDLKLSETQFNEFVTCRLSAEDYKIIMAQFT